MNTRLQVEHPITEVTNDFDLVKAQIRVAAGNRLTERPTEFGHAVEARLNAEDPDRDFAPSPGRITRLDLPAGPGIRVDTGVAEGDQIPADFDSMIAKIIAFGRDRDEALGRLRRAMAETTVVIEGGATNKSFILELLDRPRWSAPRASPGPTPAGSTGCAARAAGRRPALRRRAGRLGHPGLRGHRGTIEIARLLETAHGGRPQVQHSVGRAVDLKLRGVTYQVTAFRIGPQRYRVRVAQGDESSTVEASLQRLDDFHSRLQVGDQRYRLVTATHGPVHLIEVNGVTHRVSRDEGGVLRSPAPALVVATPVAVGEQVAAGAPVLVLESMKMETVLVAPFACRVKELLVITGSQVETMAPLVRLEPVADGPDAVEEVAPPAPASNCRSATPAITDPAARAHRLLADLSALVMGFDADPDYRPLAEYLAAPGPSCAPPART